MQICLNMQQNGAFKIGETAIDEKSPMSIIIRTTSDYKTLELLDSAREYIKRQGIRDQVIATSINQILKDAGCKALSTEQVKDLLASGSVKPYKENAPLIGDEPLKNANLAMSK